MNVTKFELMNGLFCKQPTTLPTGRTTAGSDPSKRAHILMTGQIESIEREDGSGHCFNVVIADAANHGKRVKLFIKTID